MRCPNCRDAMKRLNTDIGIGMAIHSFYCRKCDVSVTDSEVLDIMAETFCSKPRFAVSQLAGSGFAS